MSPMTNGLSPLAVYIQELLDRRGWRQKDLAVAAEMAPTTLNNIFSKPHVEQRLSTLEKLAEALDVPLELLIEKAGFALDLQGRPELCLLADLQHKNPRIRKMLEKLCHLSAEQQDVVEAIITTLLNQRQRSSVSV